MLSGAGLGPAARFQRLEQAIGAMAARQQQSLPAGASLHSTPTPHYQPKTVIRLPDNGRGGEAGGGDDNDIVVIYKLVS